MCEVRRRRRRRRNERISTTTYSGLMIALLQYTFFCLPSFSYSLHSSSFRFFLSFFFSFLCICVYGRMSRILAMMMYHLFDYFIASSSSFSFFFYLYALSKTKTTKKNRFVFVVCIRLDDKVSIERYF